jgi:hypothetical protein
MHSQEVFCMQTQYLIPPEVPQVPPYEAQQMAQGLAGDLALFLFPFLVTLDRLLDKRLVRTFVQTIQVILAYRDRVGGLLLSELGGYLLSPEQAPAGSKRLSNLLHSPKWDAQVVGDELWREASQQVHTWQEQGEEGLAIWDGSEWEKPESEAAEDLCAVRSSKAKRLSHIKPGYYNPPTRPIVVPGLHWLAVVLVGRVASLGPPRLAAMRWWSSRGVHASFRRDEEGKLLLCLLQWGRMVVHVFDQGFAGAFWLGLLLAFGLRFVLRWRKDYQLLDAQGNRRKTWRIAMGKRGWAERTMRDSRRAHWVVSSVLALPVRHPEHPESPLWLVVCRSKGRTPWYLLTAEPITTDEDAWRVVFAYMRRWQIELTWRFNKSELAFESPRLWRRQEREKLLALATLAYAFLLHLLAPPYEPLRCWLLRHFCHRTGWHLRQVRAPLYRLRSALSRLWQRYPPCFAALGSPPRTQALVTFT